MTETESKRRQEILDAALHVFARLGFDRASIKDIAQEAGLKSSALLYWYFKNKQELLLAVIMENIPVIQDMALNPQTFMEVPPRDLLRLVSNAFIGVFDNHDAVLLLRIILSEAGRVPELTESIGQVQLAMLNFFASYLQHHMNIGTLKSADPQAAARMFLGSMLAYVITGEVFVWLREGLPTRDLYIEQTVNTFLQGLEKE